MNQIYELNPAEGIFYPAFDKYLCEDGQIYVERGEIKRLWDSLTFRGGQEFTVYWKGEVKTEGYDNFLAFLSYPEEAWVTVTGVIDGVRKCLVEKAYGGELPVELEGRLFKESVVCGAGILTELKFTFHSSLEHTIVILNWLGLSDNSRKGQIEKRVPVWKNEWEDEICKEVPGKIENNLIFTKEEGEALKERTRRDPRLMSFYRTNAEEGLKLVPQKLLREYAPENVGMYRFVRVRDRGRDYLEGPILNLAIAGYLLDDAKYSAHAARLILSLIAMKWCEGSVCDMKGSKFHHVCFTEDHMLTEVVLAMGFLGGVLKESAIERVTAKIEEAFWVIHEKNCEPGYRNFMNQGIVGCRGTMLGALYLQLHKGGCEEKIEACYQRHTGMIRRYLTAEGQGGEGGSYFEYSFAASILLWQAYAKYSGWECKEVVPEAFWRAGRYQEALMSVNNRRGERITLNCDTGNEVSTLLLIFMTMMCDFKEGSNYLIARFEGNEVEQITKSFDRLFYEYWKEKTQLHPYYRVREEEISLPQSGLLTYRQGSTKLLVSAERNPYTGHFHEDRGQVVLQAEGETLLPDLGTLQYGDSRSILMAKQEYHNLACPMGLTMAVASQKGIEAAAAAAYPITEELTAEDMAMPEAKVLSHGVTGNGYEFCVETGMLFGEGVRGIRQGCLQRRKLKLQDEWKFETPQSLMITFLSYAPWEVSGETGKANSGRMLLCVETESSYHFEIEEGMVDCKGRKVYILRILTEKKSQVTVKSCFTWKPLELSDKQNGAKNRIALQELLDQGGTIRIEKQGTYEIEDTLYIESHTHLFLGKGVILKRAASSIGSFFLINRGAFEKTWDSDITIEGLQLMTNGVEARYHSAIYGLTGEVSLFYVKELKVFDFVCMDLPRLSYGLHICTFEDIVLERLHIEGRKDAVHLGTGKCFVIRHGVFRTYDDPIALNAHDYAVANPQMGWIEDGLIEDCYDLEDESTVGYFCRILAGSWVDWYPSMEIQNSDTVVSGGRVYRAFQKPDGVVSISKTAPMHKEGMSTLDGINWVMVQENVVYNCGCRNIHFKDIHLLKKRDVALSIHFDHDWYSRSVYPSSEMPVQENIVFENIVVENEIACMVRSITPVDVIKIVNSVIGTKKTGNSNICLETLRGQEGQYPKTHIVLQGNTCYGDPVNITCEEGRNYCVVNNGNINLLEE